jgi:SAM-dependent methyltransferase
MVHEGSTANRGLDGLTTAELCASRLGWWDEAFTDLLVRRVPHGATRLLDAGCGLAHAAHSLLPRVPGATYLGIDADAERLRGARQLLAGAPYESRAWLCLGRLERLPCREGEFQLALTSMTLQHLPDPAAGVREIARALAPGGVLVAVEPDNTNNLFYFDGVLDQVNEAFRELSQEQRRRRRPADIALGPRLGRMLENASLAVIELFPYAAGRARKLVASHFFARARRVVEVVAASLPPGGGREAESCLAALARAEATVGSDTEGCACQLVPLFVCVGQKP